MEYFILEPRYIFFLYDGCVLSNEDHKETVHVKNLNYPYTLKSRSIGYSIEYILA